MAGRSGFFRMGAFVGLAAELGGVSESRAAATAALLLASGRVASDRAARSLLNNDGTPLQICVTLREDGRAVRLLGDPGAWAGTLGERFAAGAEAMEELFRETALIARCRRIVSLALPAELAGYEEATNGILWLGCDLEGTGKALYVKARWGGAGEDWARLAGIAGEILPEPEEAIATIHALAAPAHPVSVGLETAGGRSRLKFYWCLDRPVLLKTLGIRLLDDGMGGFLGRAVGVQRLRPSGLVFSTGFSLASGHLSDVKLDVCAHCVRRTEQNWLDIVGTLAREHGLVAPVLDDALMSKRSEMAFVGFGVGAKGEKRLNLYLKPPAASMAARPASPAGTRPAARHRDVRLGADAGLP